MLKVYEGYRIALPALMQIEDIEGGLAIFEESEKHLQKLKSAGIAD